MSVIVLNWSPCEPKSHPTGCGCKFFIITKDCEKLNQYSFICCINCEKNFVQFHRMFAMYILIILYCFWSLISWLLLPTRPCFQGTNMTNPVKLFFLGVKDLRIDLVYKEENVEYYIITLLFIILQQIIVCWWGIQ